MRRYSLTLNILLTEIPEPPPAASITKPSLYSDPAGKVLDTVISTMPVFTGPVLQQEPTGLSFRKSIQLSVGTFRDLADILEQFEKLASEIELERAG